jgi:hypothetical protein
MKAGRSQYHNNVSEVTEQISEIKIHAADNNTQSTIMTPASEVPHTGTPTKITQDSPKHETTTVINQTSTTSHEPAPYFAVNEAVVNAISQYAEQLNAIVLETSAPISGTNVTSITTTNVPIIGNS